MVNFDANRRESTLCSTWMRILHVPHAYAPAIGGAETLVRRVGIELAARGHEVTVITSDLTSAEGFFEPGVAPVGVAEEIDAGVRVKRVPLSPRIARRNHRDWTQTRFSRALRALTKGHDFDVVMALPHLLPNVIGAVELCKERNIPLVLTPLLHENDPNWPTDDLRKVLDGAGAVIALTKHEADRLVLGYGLDRHRIFVSGLGVDVPDIPTGQRSPSVLFLGRLAPSKNLALLTAAMRNVWEVRDDVELIVAGSQVPGGGDLHTMVGPGSPQGHPIKFLADIGEEEKTQLLRSCRCLVSPSERESFGLVLLEAMAHGTPVVAIDSQVNREVVPEGTGILTEANPTSMGAALLTLLEHPQEAEEIGDRGRDHVKSNRSWQSVGETYQAAYRHASDHA